MNKSMLQNLVIEGKKDTFFIPSVHFNADSGICSLEGESYLEDSVKFYRTLHTWLKNFMQSEQKIIFNIKLTYFNTSSEKGIFDILILLKRYEDDGNEVIVNWYHLKDDEDSIEEAEDFIYDTGLQLNLIAY